MRSSVFNESILMVSLSRFGGLTVRPWASFFSSLLVRDRGYTIVMLQQTPTHDLWIQMNARYYTRSMSILT
jgi:hypothetical protein